MTAKPPSAANGRSRWPARPGWLDNFLLSILAVLGLAALTPEWGGSHGQLGLGRWTSIGILLVFLLHGAQVPRERLRSGSRNFRLHALVQASTYVGFPLLGLLGYLAMRPFVAAPLSLGFFYLCAVPSTIATAVTLVGIARGNVPAAIFNATLSGLIGIALTPVLVSLVAATSGLHLPWMDAMRSLLLTVLLPFAVGHLLQPWLLPILRQFPRLARGVERGAILLVMYVAFCDAVAADAIHQASPAALLLVLFAVLVLLAAILLGLRQLARGLGLPVEDEITLLLCGSQKSLANGMPMAKALFGSYPSLGLLVLPMLAFHQAQLLAGAILARRYAART